MDSKAAWEKVTRRHRRVPSSGVLLQSVATDNQSSAEQSRALRFASAILFTGIGVLSVRCALEGRRTDEQLNIVELEQSGLFEGLGSIAIVHDVIMVNRSRFVVRGVGQ
jgi:hypothetical protein